MGPSRRVPIVHRPTLDRGYAVHRLDRPRITQRCPDLNRAEAGGFPDRQAVHSDRGPSRRFTLVGSISPGRRHRSPGLERSWRRVRFLMGNLSMALLRFVGCDHIPPLLFRMPRLCKFINATAAKFRLCASELLMEKNDRKSRGIQDFRAADHHGELFRRSLLSSQAFGFSRTMDIHGRQLSQESPS